MAESVITRNGANESEATQIATNTSDISALKTSVATNTTNIATNASSIETETDRRKSADNILSTEINSKAPKNHTSTDSTYGLATSSVYGHVKLNNSYTTYSSGVAFSQLGAYNLNNAKQNKITYTYYSGVSETVTLNAYSYTDVYVSLNNASLSGKKITGVEAYVLDDWGTINVGYYWVDVSNNRVCVPCYNNCGSSRSFRARAAVRTLII